MTLTFLITSTPLLILILERCYKLFQKKVETKQVHIYSFFELCTFEIKILKSVSRKKLLSLHTWVTSRNFLSECNVENEKFTVLQFHTVWSFQKFSPTAKIFRQIDLQYNSLSSSEKVDLTEYLQKIVWKLRQFTVTFF